MILRDHAKRTFQCPLVLLPVIGLIALGCGDNSTRPQGDPSYNQDTQVTLDNVCDGDNGVFVKLIVKIVECFPEFSLQLGLTPDAAALNALCEGTFQPFLLDETIQLGTREDLIACSQYVEALECSDLSLGQANPCDNIVIGMVELGGECDIEEQCVGQAFCDTSGEGCGVCVARKADGESCFGNDECLGRNCSGYDDRIPTVAGTCAGYGEIGDLCAFNRDCRGSRICDRTQNPPRCAAEPTWQAGMPCGEFPADCGGILGDMYCAMGSNVCTEYAEIGETCGGLSDPLCRIFNYESCADVGGGVMQCVAAQTAKQGEFCGFLFGRMCEAGHRCADNDGNPATPDICIKLRDESESCSPPASLCDGFLQCVNDTCQYGEYSGSCPAPN